MLCMFMEIQACENERISGGLKILNAISRKEGLRKNRSFFLLRDTKKSSKKIYFRNKNLKK